MLLANVADLGELLHGSNVRDKGCDQTSLAMEWGKSGNLSSLCFFSGDLLEAKWFDEDRKMGWTKEGDGNDDFGMDGWTMV